MVEPGALPPVGFVGLGDMGGAIADRLIDMGVALHVRDANPAAAARLVARGATEHPSARSLADAVEIVCTCLPNERASRAVVEGGDGLQAGRRIRFYVEMATVGATNVRDFAATMAAKGVATMDAPVSGGAAVARSGRLTIMTGGSAETLAAVRPVLEAISPVIVPIGERPGDGQTMKLVNNLLAAANMATSFEALVLGVKLGLSPSRMTEVIGRSSGASSGFTPRRIDSIRTRRFDNGGRIALLDKDIALAFAQAGAAGIDVGQLPSLSGMSALWTAAMAQGLADEDVTALVRVVEERLGTEVREA